MKRLSLILLMPGILFSMEEKLSTEAVVIIGSQHQRNTQQRPAIYNNNETHCHTHIEASDHEDDGPGRTCCSQRSQVVLALGFIAACSTIISSMIAASVAIITHVIK